MAAIRKRSKNQWQAQVRIKGNAPLSKTFRTRQDAEKWAKLQESAILVGLPRPRPETSAMTVLEALERYAKEVSPRKKSHQKELCFVRRLKAIPLAKRVLGSITSKDMAVLRDERLQEVSAASVVRELALLSHLFTVASKEWGMDGLQNPMLNIQKPRLPKGRSRRLTLNEVNALIAATESPLLGQLVKFALETGMRRSEICALTWADIDLNKSMATLRDSKNGESRLIPLSDRAKTTLEAISESREGRVFRVSPDSISQAFKRACRRAKLNDLRFHDLRHEATSRFFEKGLSVMEAALITGHKDLRMLIRYTHLNPTGVLAKLN
jgi:integrase